jgi:hypothetical protein
MITLCAWNVEEDATAASHLTIAHALTPAMYHQRAGLPHDYPLVCVELSREIAKRARANDLGRQGRGHVNRGIMRKLFRDAAGPMGHLAVCTSGEQSRRTGAGRTSGQTENAI